MIATGAAESGPRRGWAARAAAAAPPAALAVLAFVLTSELAGALAGAGAFRYIDLLFDADCAWFLDGFAEGLGTGTAWGARSIVHPNPANLVNPPIRVIAGACGALGVCEAPPADARAALALYVAPLAAAAETVFLYLAAASALRSRRAAVAAALVNLALLPTLVFGAMPESFALTGCGLAAVFYLTSRAAAGRPVATLSWSIAGTFLTGVTITNLAPFALAHALTVSAQKGGVRRALPVTIRLCAGVALCTAALAGGLGTAFGALDDFGLQFQQLSEVRAPREELRSRRWVEALTGQTVTLVTRAAIDVPAALGQTLVPPRPQLVRLPADPGAHPREAPARITYRGAGLGWGTVATLAVLAGAIAGTVRARSQGALVFRVAAALLAYNWVFHTIFGVEIFLYAKHWSVPLAMLLGVWLEGTWIRARLGTAVLIGLLAAAGATSAVAIGFIVAAVRSGF
jgi:hypothetical protein